MCEDCPSTAPCSCWEEWRSRFLWDWDGGHSSGVSPGLGLGSGPTMPHSRVWAWRPLYHLSPQTSPGRYLWPSDLAPHPGRCSSHTHPPASPWAPSENWEISLDPKSLSCSKFYEWAPLTHGKVQSPRTPRGPAPHAPAPAHDGGPSTNRFPTLPEAAGIFSPPS